ncbi:tyrosine-type recombinase/integrase [Pseudomonas sp. DTU_2021_1001937_2_SI_NGA_ILE_001]|uniref:site-specific integrase n=1 Tax=Pseudomonas sp. DTU_2021_1001937_2_SI_NGA_ILE_001 TaxID=3077589 RepID=UPI0028FC1310|nr:tyrosine-type recombinase/integrase [Pseudomonas sp. DTU_2021_1001937_2_SI_NGA_ILE_001]WNW10085.1 tyrosine-type recombinase/integrase [Pseudomonas sp. DTU_2021_1001937_2_SI_NGA_ILE_001]
MGRRPSKPGSIARLRERKKASGTTYYYYDTGGHPRKEIPLGSDYGLAIMKYAEFERDRTSSALVTATITFRYVAEKYFVDVVPNKARTTQADNARELKNLIAFFDDPPAPLESILPQHVRQYLNWRKAAPVRANREKALLSSIWNYARDTGYTALANPCSGIKGNKEKGRDVYVEDSMYSLVYDKADDGLKDAMDLAYLTGQRVSDTLAMDERNIRDGQIWIVQSKTNAKRRIEIVGELEALLTRIRTRKAGYRVHSTKLIVADDGQSMTYSMLRKRFDDARAAAGVDKSAFQFRDLRAKAGTDKAESSGDIVQARDQLGHTTVVMTEKYVRERKGKKVTPTR